MSLDPVKLCEFCGNSVNHEDHRETCPEAWEASAPILPGSTREDEDGWFIVDRAEHDGDDPGYWVSDRWGAEKFISASRMGDNWKAPL